MLVTSCMILNCFVRCSVSLNKKIWVECNVTVKALHLKFTLIIISKNPITTPLVKLIKNSITSSLNEISAHNPKLQLKSCRQLEKSRIVALCQSTFNGVIIMENYAQTAPYKNYHFLLSYSRYTNWILCIQTISFITFVGFIRLGIEFRWNLLS